MNSKKAITLLVLLTLILGMIPFAPVSAVLDPVAKKHTGAALPDNDNNLIKDVYKGLKVAITDIAGAVASGEVVTIYWDDSTIAWNGVKGKLNQTTAKASGAYEVWFKVPEATVGTHYVWVRSGTLEPKSIALQVVPKVSLSPSSGLRGDKVDVTAYGLTKDADIAVFLVDDALFANWGWAAATAQEFTISNKKVTGTLNTKPVKNETVTFENIAYAPVSNVTDNGKGSLYYGSTKVGSINYVTGVFDIDYSKVTPTITPTGTVEATYDAYVLTANTVYLLTTVGDSNSLGSYVKRVTIPSYTTPSVHPATGTYYVAVMDHKGYFGVKAFVLGSVITISKVEGAVGNVIRISGRGFTDNAEIPEAAGNKATTAGISLTDGTTYWKARIVGYDPADKPKVSSTGEFRIDIYLPDPDEVSEDYEIVVNDGSKYATAEFEITAVPSITVAPNYGAQGSKFTVKGTNFVNLKDEKVYFYLYNQDTNDYDRDALTTADDDFSGAYVKVNSDGSFTKELRVPSQLDGTYDLVAIYWHRDLTPTVNMEAKKTFRVGTILVLLSEDEGEAGRKIVLSGNGFTADKSWNATFNGKTLIDDTGVNSNGLITANFFVPQVAPGVYNIVVIDVDTLITVTVPFTVTAATQFTANPSTAPTGYNITFTAQNWPEGVQEWEFILYNVTTTGAVDRDWDITDEVYSSKLANNKPFDAPADDEVTEVLQAKGWWILEQPNGDPLSKGTYLLNITNTADFHVQITIVVGDEHVSITPRKATFRIGETVTLNIQHSFGNVEESAGGEIKNGRVKIYNPSGALYWNMDALLTWTKSGMYYYVPYANQVANGNPLILLDDAPLGTWTYKWYENNAVAGVGGDGSLITSGTFTVAAKEADVIAGQIEDLNAALTDLQTDITTVSTDMAAVRTQITNAINAANAAVQAANAATQAVNAVAQTASAASTAATNAANAATEAKNAANGLTTLVYGAIGASLVAALAAIVSLMQISRRIAG